MASPRPTKRLASPIVQHSEPQHPSALIRRISMGFSTFMSVVPLRRTTPHQEPVPRPTTAPTPNRPLTPRGIGPARATGQQTSIPRIRSPSSVEPQQACPYDRTKYHSFSRIERSRCTFCGMRSSRPSTSEPCKDCRSKSPFSHIKLGFRQMPKVESRKEVKSPTPEFVPRYSSSSDERPRVVPPEIAAKRIGNPPRRAALPVPRPGAINNTLNPHPNPLESRCTKQSPKSSGEHAPKSEQGRPTSPKLHHLHGLPDSKAYPYVHKKEVQQHFAAIRAGASSPLADFANAVQQRKEQDQSIDFSETVYYGRIPKPALVSDVHTRFPEQAKRSNVFVEHKLVMGEYVVTERSRSERPRSLDEQLHNSNVHARRSPVQHSQQPRVERAFDADENNSPPSTDETSSAVAKAKVKSSSEDEHILKLRGGGSSGGENNHAASSGCGLLFKQLLLTCHRPRRGSRLDMSSDDDSPARIPDPVHIARTQRRTHGTARLPAHLTREHKMQLQSRTARTSRSNRDAVGVPRAQTPGFVPAYPPQRPFVCTLFPLTCRSSYSEMRLRSAEVPVDAAGSRAQVISSVAPGLRGGAGSPSTLRDRDSLPRTLSWLACGGRRKATGSTGGEAQKPKAAKGGLLGSAVHEKAGRDSKRQDGRAGPGLRKERGKVGGGKSVKVSEGREASLGGGLAEKGKRDAKPCDESRSGGVPQSGMSGDAGVVEQTKREAAVDPVAEVAAESGGTIAE